MWVLKFGTWFEFQRLKQGQNLWHYWLKNKMKIVLKEPINGKTEKLTEFKKINKYVMIHR